jgi:hypothetical protein
MRWLKDPDRLQVALTAALVVIAAGCSLFGVIDDRLSTPTPREVPPADRLNSFLAAYPAAVVARLPLENVQHRVCLSLYDFSGFPSWHFLSGEKALMLMVRPRNSPGGDQWVIQKSMIDLEHDGTIDFVIEGRRKVSDEVLSPMNADLVRGPTEAEQRLFAETCANPQLVATLNADCFQDTIDWVHNRT